VLVAHAYNLGGRDQEDHDSKPARANSSQGPVLKILNTKKGWWRVAQGVSLEFKPQYQNKNYYDIVIIIFCTFLFGIISLAFVVLLSGALMRK
jgi:hypothetical protein